MPEIHLSAHPTRASACLSDHLLPTSRLRMVAGLAFLISCTAFSAEKSPSHDRVAGQTIAKSCQHLERSMDDVFEFGDVNICLYNTASLLKAYADYRTAYQHGNDIPLRTLAPGKNRVVPCRETDSCMEVEYKWSGVRELLMSQFYQGGITTVRFTHEKGAIRVETTAFPD